MGAIESLFGRDAAILRRFEFQVILVSTFPAALGSSILSPILDSLTGPFGVSASTAGLLVTAFFAPAIVVTPIAGSLADRFGRKPLLVLSLVLFGAGGVAIVTTTDFRLVLFYRLVQGVGSGILLPVLVASIGDLYTDDEEATAQGFRTAVHALSGAVIPVLAGVLVVAAWQYPFYIYAVCFPIAALVLRYFEEPTDGGDGSHSAPTVGDLLSVLRRPRAFAAVAGMALPAFLLVSFMTYNSILVGRGMGGTPREAGILAATASLSIATAASQSGRVTSRFDTRRVALAGGNFAIGCGLAVVAVAGSLLVAVPAVAGLGFGVGLLMSQYRSVLTGLAPVHLRGGLVSLGETSRVVGATAAPLVVGVLIELYRPAVGELSAIRQLNVAVGVVGLLVGLALVVLVGRFGDGTPTEP